MSNVSSVIESGAPIGLRYRETAYAADVFDTYFFEKNLQGDIVAVYNSAGTKIGTYTYDAWGACGKTLITSGVTAVERFIVARYNPFRYRGYYYDIDIGMYYLQSRYYNPNWGRFLNADGYVSTGQGLLGYNMFAYCRNNPIMGYDPTGSWDWGIFWDVFMTAYVATLSVIWGVGSGIAELVETGDLLQSGEKMIRSTGEAFGQLNNTVNKTYYALSNGTTTIDEGGDISAYVTDGYLSRWNRLDYVRGLEQSATMYGANEKEYFAEYSAHMYAWLVIGWTETSNPECPASRAKKADVVWGKSDEDKTVAWISEIIGGLGI